MMNNISEKEMEIKDNRVVIVYMESTPNPNAMKFVTSDLLLEQGTREYANKNSATDSPLAFQLFDFSGVQGVFITSNFVTVTKQNDIDWFDIQNILREFIRSFLVSGESVFIEGAKDEGRGTSGVDSETDLTVISQTATIAPRPVSPATFPEVEAKIISLLDEYVKPAVENDGGAIDFKSFDDGVVTLTLRGSCSGCPSSTQTLKAGIERLLTQMLPEVKEVVAEG